jgi:hypothetical protein
MLNEGNQSRNFYTVSVRTFVIPFYYGFGSGEAKSYGSYGSGSTTRPLCVILLSSCSVLFLDPESFGNTVENMFHVSFLVKHHKAGLAIRNPPKTTHPEKPTKNIFLFFFM